MGDDPDGAEAVPDGTRDGWSWSRIATIAGGVVTIVGATVAVTLAATHKTAVRENGVAYVNGRVDGYSAGFLDGVRFFFAGDDIDDWWDAGSG